MLLFFLLCGRYLDHAMRRKTRDVAANLAALKAEFAAPPRARRRNYAGAGRGACGRAIGFWCVPANAFPPTAVVIGGRSEIDESLVTGETGRRAVARRREVYAGSIKFPAR